MSQDDHYRSVFFFFHKYFAFLAPFKYTGPLHCHSHKPVISLKTTHKSVERLEALFSLKYKIKKCKIHNLLHVSFRQKKNKNWLDISRTVVAMDNWLSNVSIMKRKKKEIHGAGLYFVLPCFKAVGHTFTWHFSPHLTPFVSLQTSLPRALEPANVLQLFTKCYLKLDITLKCNRLSNNWRKKETLSWKLNKNRKVISR